MIEEIINAIKEISPPPSPIYQAVVLHYMDKHKLLHEIASVVSENRRFQISSVQAMEQSVFGIVLLESLHVPIGRDIPFENIGKAHEFVAYCKMHGYANALEYFNLIPLGLIDEANKL